MQLNTLAFAATTGIFWGGAILVVAVANLVWPGYGAAFLALADSIYPGYDAGAGAGSVITGALYGLTDGVVGGLVFALVYNLLAPRFSGVRD